MTMIVDTEIDKERAIERDPAEAAGLNIKDFTNAPLKFLGVYEFDVSPTALWPWVTDANKIAMWFPIISSGRHMQGTAPTHEQCEAGSKRMCKTIGMGTLDETFLFSERPKVSVYNVENFMMPIKNHAAVMHLEETEPGKTRMTWAHYADYRGMLMRFIFPTMMTVFMNIGIKKLASIVGGKGGHTRAF